MAQRDLVAAVFHSRLTKEGAAVGLLRIDSKSRRGINVLNTSVGTQLSQLILSWLCSNEDLQWTPQCSHSTADSPHSFSTVLRGTLEKKQFSLVSFLISLPPPLLLSSSHHPPQPGRHCGPVCALFDVVLEVNRRGKHLTQLLNREHLNVS